MVLSLKIRLSLNESEINYLICKGHKSISLETVEYVLNSTDIASSLS